MNDAYWLQKVNEATDGGFTWGLKHAAEKILALAEEYRDHKMFEQYILLSMTAKLLLAQHKPFDEAQMKMWTEIQYENATTRKSQFYACKF